MSIFEMIMLGCFGAGWPFSIWKSLKTRKVEGKSPVFLTIISLGYVSGILHKITFDMDKVVFLYFLNLAMVLTDLYLYFRLRTKA